MKIYTKKGDRGETSLFSGRRARKDDACVAAVGDLDELSAALGLARAVNPFLADQIIEIQRNLYVISARLSAEGKRDIPGIPEQAISALEAEIDRFDAQLPPLTDFVVPGQTENSARLHLARAICRRAERSCIGTNIGTPPETTYLNRLSDVLFMWARWEVCYNGAGDIKLKS
ncbi:cob(I)yrinic acid a,c-diamide adenosyltransferase [Terrihabitans sp. B22-R8]|uniref:cob(I)yrinic acid a,c-diamide adenosyltransferase n=1 Tax=Terrihabitans sp. B22-R8 TaxID=3425128 RepID=UPI00403C5BCC